MKSGSWAGYFTGNVYVSGLFSNPSDASVKEGIVDAESLLEKVAQIQVRNYFFRKGDAMKYGFPKNRQTGFIAQEFETLFPNLVQEVKLIDAKEEGVPGNSSKTIKSINYMGMIPVLTKAVQEQQIIIDRQNTEIEAQKKDIEDLKIQLLEIKALLQDK